MWLLLIRVTCLVAVDAPVTTETTAEPAVPAAEAGDDEAGVPEDPTQAAPQTPSEEPESA
jgi:hypothetical protein